MKTSRVEIRDIVDNFVESHRQDKGSYAYSMGYIQAIFVELVHGLPVRQQKEILKELSERAVARDSELDVIKL